MNKNIQSYERLEQDFGELCGCKNTVACSSGTAALHLALEALELPRYSEVIIPEYTMIACARAVTLAGLRPVFVDCGPDLLIDVTKIEDKITGKTAAIMPVHIYGRVCNMEEIHRIANKCTLSVVEDCAEVSGANLGPFLSDARCWSFYKNKIVAGEEGGMIAFKDARAEFLARSLRSLGFTETHDFLHFPRGMNYRLANSLAELVLDSLFHVDENIKKRRRVEKRYDELIPDDWKMPKRDVVWVYDIKLQGQTRKKLLKIVSRLNEKDIAARMGFVPMSFQIEYFDKSGSHGQQAEKFVDQIIYLPVYPKYTYEKIQYFVKCLKDFVD